MTNIYSSIHPQCICIILQHQLPPILTPILTSPSDSISHSRIPHIQCCFGQTFAFPNNPPARPASNEGRKNSRRLFESCDNNPAERSNTSVLRNTHKIRQRKREREEERKLQAYYTVYMLCMRTTSIITRINDLLVTDRVKKEWEQLQRVFFFLSFVFFNGYGVLVFTLLVNMMLMG